MKDAWTPLAVVCVLVIGVYAYTAQSGVPELLTPTAADTYYNLLVRGFRAGQLSLKKEVPPGFAQLPDPYDPVANALYRSPSYGMHDMSYYKGRLYLGSGVTPALILFWPFVALTGHYLFHRQAVVIFCAIGFLASVGLLRAIWRRHFAEVSGWAVAACALALGLATGMPLLLSRCEAYEVAVSCGYMLTMLALVAIWRALHEPDRRCRWLAAASLAYGLAMGARPYYVSAVILLVPVFQAWRERRPECLPQSTWFSALLAAVGPLALIGLGLMLYNFHRFGSPFEFGYSYSLSTDHPEVQHSFDLNYLWFNFRVYFLAPARWSGRFPFVHEIVLPPLPVGHGSVEDPFGVLSNIPVVWLALAGPLAWRKRSAEADSILRWFVAAVALLFGICALSIGFYFGTCIRYEVDFLPALMLLAVVGILGLERALADRPAWRRAARWGWGLLLGFSVAFNLLASVEHYAEVQDGLGAVLGQGGRTQEAITHFEEALQIEPDYPEAHYNLGVVLEQAGRTQEAIRHYEEALRIEPDFAVARYNLGNTLAQAGRVEGAIEQYEQALRIKPDDAEVHNNLGACLSRLGRAREALAHYEQAVRLKPDYAEAHLNLGIALGQAGRIPEAIEQLEQALRIKPDFTDARNALTRLQGGK